MGSSNIQCAISKETIESGDEVVTFILEPVLTESGDMQKILKPASNQGEYFRINSLPIFGIYFDYGRSIATNNQDCAISLVKEFYGFDYSEELGDEWGQRGYRLKRGGCVKSPHETNTAELVILKDIYDTLIENTDSTIVEKLLSAGQFKKAFQNAIDPQLLSAIKSHAQHNLVIAAATILKGLRNLGSSLTPGPTICAQTASDDFKMSLDIRSELKEKNVSLRDGDHTPRAFCQLTKNAIAEGEIVYLLPLISNKEYNQPIDLISFDNYSVTSRYKPISKPLKCIYKDGEFSLLESEDTSFVDIRSQLSLPASMSFDDVLGVITENRSVVKKSCGFEFNYLVSYVVFGEHAFNCLIKEEPESYRELEMDAESFLSSLIKLHAIANIEYEDFDALKEAIKNSGCFYGKHLDAVIFTINKYSERTMCQKDVIQTTIERAVSKIAPYIESGEEFPRLYNSFYQIALSYNLGDSLLHNNIAMNNQEKIIELLEYTSCEKEFGQAIKNVIDNILEANKLTIRLFSGLDRAAVPLMPSDDYAGNLSVSEQRFLNDELSKVSYKRLVLKVNECDELY